MANYTVGDMIRDTREQRGYSQEQLSQGICAISTLSRIECGTQMPNRRVFEALMQRLGRTDSLFHVYISKEEMEQRQLSMEIVSMISNCQYHGLAEKVRQFEHKIRDNNQLDRQFTLYVQALIVRHENGSMNHVFDMLMDAIHITMPDFKVDEKLKSRLLTYDEIMILNSIAMVCWTMNRFNKALEIVYWLKEYMEQHILDEEEKAKKYPSIIENLAMWVGFEKRYEEALELCELGIDICQKYGKLITMPKLLYGKACALVELGKEQSAKRHFLESYYMSSSLDDAEFMKIIADNIEKRYGIEVLFFNLPSN